MQFDVPKSETTEQCIQTTLKNIKNIAEDNDKFEPASNKMLYEFALLLSKLAEVSSSNADRIEKQTAAVIRFRLTRWLVALTWALLIFTAYLAFRH